MRSSPFHRALYLVIVFSILSSARAQSGALFSSEFLCLGAACDLIKCSNDSECPPFHTCTGYSTSIFGKGTGLFGGNGLGLGQALGQPLRGSGGFVSASPAVAAGAIDGIWSALAPDMKPPIKTMFNPNFCEPSGLRQPSNIVTPGGYFVTADMKEWVPPGPDRLVDLPETSELGSVYNTPSLNQRLSYRVPQNSVTSVETERTEKRTAPPAQVSINGGLIQYDYDTNAYGEPILVARSVYDEAAGGSKDDLHASAAPSDHMTAESLTVSADIEAQIAKSTGQQASRNQPVLQTDAPSGTQRKPAHSGKPELSVLLTHPRQYKEVRSTVTNIDAPVQKEQRLDAQQSGAQGSPAPLSSSDAGAGQKQQGQTQKKPPPERLPTSIFDDMLGDQRQPSQIQQKFKEQSPSSLHRGQADPTRTRQPASNEANSSSRQEPAEMKISTSAPSSAFDGGLEAQVQSLLLKQLEALDSDQVDALLKQLMSESGTPGASIPSRRLLRGLQSADEEPVKKTEGIEKFLAFEWLEEMALDALTANKFMLTDTVGFQNLLQYGANVNNAKWEAQINCLTPVAMGFTPLGAVIIDLANTSDSASLIRNDLFEAFIKGNRENQRKPLVTVTEVANMRDLRRDFAVIVCTRPGRFVTEFKISVAFAGQEGKVTNLCPVEVLCEEGPEIPASELALRFNTELNPEDEDDEPPPEDDEDLPPKKQKKKKFLPPEDDEDAPPVEKKKKSKKERRNQDF
ncbi:hypothetical protein CSUI_009064 [Cystoisospora suis]|uniref:Transmembrane protein n=1 Tax=Cystoisospora suis TaxID=483139 RepID=A0A2C6KKV4_9APIC|nr:hypothetical protein CSUI_009064 [Cystoisospora suis]